MFRSNERLSRTRICDVKFVKGKIDYVYRDPQLIRTKRDSKKSRVAYGVIGRWSGLKHGPYQLIEVSLKIITFSRNNGNYIFGSDVRESIIGRWS